MSIDNLIIVTAVVKIPLPC